MSWLYAITVYPLELIFKYVYMLCITVTGSYGLGLVALSLCCAVAYVPLNRMAVETQNRERHLQDVLKPQIDRINTTSSGAERQARIARLYKRYSYHPIMAVRSAVSVFLQFPFLFAAYYMVSGLTILQGKSFWFIPDLSRPDMLWNGINLLPLAMTAINILSTLVAPYMHLRERIQAFVIALLFLWMLYSAPSALLFYWCCNNVIYVFQNLWIRSTTTAAGQSSAHSSALQWNRPLELTPQSRKKLGIVFFSLFALAALASTAAFRDLFHCIYDLPEGSFAHVYRAGYYCAGLLALFAGIFSARRLLLSSTGEISVREHVVKCSLLAAGLAALGSLLAFYLIPAGEPNIDGTWVQVYFWGIALYSIAAFSLPIPHRRVQTALEEALGGNTARLYWSCAAALIGIFFLFNVSALYYSDPLAFSVTLWSLILEMIPYILIAAVVFAALWFIFRGKTRPFLAAALFFVTIYVLLNGFTFSDRYGALDVVIFSDAQNLYTRTTVLIDALLLLCTTALFFILLAWSRIVKLVTSLFWLIAVGSVVFTGYAAVQTQKEQAAKIALSKAKANKLPPYHDRLWGFNKSGKNVIVFFFDMFSGGHMKEIFANEPQLKEKLDGFVWYPDTMAVGDNTYLSAPSIYGGHDFSPASIGKDKKNDLFTKVNMAYAVLPNLFSSLGYDVTVAGAPYADEKLMQPMLKSKNEMILDETWGKDYVPYWNEWASKQPRPIQKAVVKNDETDKYMLALSLFRVIPHSFKARLYDEGKWCGITRAIEDVQAERIVPDLAPLQFMSTFSNTDAPRSTFKVVYDLLSHMHWHLLPNSLIPVADPYPATVGDMMTVDGITPEHLYSETHMIRFVAQLGDWMKKNGIYDNTRIIIVSDHCEGDSRMLNSALGAKDSGIAHTMSRNVYPGRPHSLLLVKDFNAKGPAQIRDNLMSCEDVPALAIMDLAKASGIPTRDELKSLSSPSRVRDHFIGPWRPQWHDKYDFKLFSHYQVTGTMFKLQDWSKNLLTPKK